MPMFGGCATSQVDLAPVDLPSPAAAGDLLRKVPVPPVRRGDDARAKLAETRAALAKANGRITGSCEWVDEQRLTYNPKTEAFDCDRPPVP
jgi:hypothetical protein